jgi:hypothetical protein
MAHFGDLVTKLMTDHTFADQFHDKKNKHARDAALKSIGIDPDHPGLRDALDNVNYDAIHKLKMVLEPATVRPFN